MTRSVRTLGIAVTLFALAADAHAERVPVKITEIAGGVAYINAGRTAGLVRGTVVQFGRTRLTVTETTEKSAALELGESALAVGASGVAVAELRRAHEQRNALLSVGAAAIHAAGHIEIDGERSVCEQVDRRDQPRFGVSIGVLARGRAEGMADHRHVDTSAPLARAERDRCG